MLDTSSKIKLQEKESGKSLILAIEKLLKKDTYLLKFDVNERTITHRFGMYLQEQFPSLYVDCEYNRLGDTPKRISSELDRSPDKIDDNGRTVFPDVIVHERGTNNNNYLIIEIKKSTSSVSREEDFNKLKTYKKELKYEYALFVELITGSNNFGIFDIKWF